MGAGQLSIGVKIYHNKEDCPCKVFIHAERVGTVLYSNRVHIYRLHQNEHPSQAKLMMYGISIRTSQTRFNIGDLVLAPGDELYALVERPGLLLSVQKKKEIADPFGIYFP